MSNRSLGRARAKKKAIMARFRAQTPDDRGNPDAEVQELDQESRERDLAAMERSLKPPG